MLGNRSGLLNTAVSMGVGLLKRLPPSLRAEDRAAAIRPVRLSRFVHNPAGTKLAKKHGMLTCRHPVGTHLRVY